MTQMIIQKSNITIALLAIVALFGCSKKEVEAIQDSIDSVTFSVDDLKSYSDEETKLYLDESTKKFLWSATDTVGIYPNSGSQLYFSIGKGAGTSSVQFDGGGWAFKPSAEYYSYYPFYGDIYLDRHSIPVDYMGQKQIGPTGIDHIGPFWYMYTPKTLAESGSLHFQYKHLGCLIVYRVTGLPAGTYTKLAITANSDLFVKNGYFDLQTDSPAVVGNEFTNQLLIDLENVTVTGSSYQFYVYMVSSPAALENQQVTISIMDSQKKEYQLKKTLSSSFVAGDIRRLACTSWSEATPGGGLIPTDVQSVTLDKTVLEVNQGSSSQLTATVLPANAGNKNVEWSCSDTEVVSLTIDENVAEISGLKAGTANVTVKSCENPSLSATCAVTVTVPNGGIENVTFEDW